MVYYKGISREIAIYPPRETLHMKQVDKKGVRNQIGAYGEQIAVTYLEKKGFTVLATNYLKKWGELDIVARETSAKGDVIRFVEVKTVSYETKIAHDRAVTHETWRPEEQVTTFKLQKLHRVIESWLLEHDCASEWQIDVAAIRIVLDEKYATIKYIPNVI